MKSFLTLCAMAAATVCTAQNTVTIKVTDAPSDTLVVRMADKAIRNVESMDTLVSKTRTFTYTKTLDKARMAMVGAVNRKAEMIFLVPGQECHLSLKDGIKATSSAYYAEYGAISQSTSKALERLEEEYMTKMRAGASRDSLGRVYGPLFMAETAKANAARLDYVKAHPQSDVSAALLYELEEDREAGLNVLTADVRKGAFSDLIDMMQAQVDAEKARKEAAKLVADGCMAPDFTLKDINGKDLALSSLRGKYVVLDFWGSWCGWCIKGIPEMKKYYEKYAGKLEILGVDCNDTEQKWRAAVEKHQIPWLHVYNPRTSDVTKKYAISGFPTKIVIDPQGKIVKTVVGEDPAFYTFIDSLFQK